MRSRGGIGRCGKVERGSQSRVWVVPREAKVVEGDVRLEREGEDEMGFDRDRVEVDAGLGFGVDERT